MGYIPQDVPPRRLYKSFLCGVHGRNVLTFQGVQVSMWDNNNNKVDTEVRIG
jgi:hypothetical protein